MLHGKRSPAHNNYVFVWLRDETRHEEQVAKYFKNRHPNILNSCDNPIISPKSV